MKNRSVNESNADLGPTGRAVHERGEVGKVQGTHSSSFRRQLPYPFGRGLHYRFVLFKATVFMAANARKGERAVGMPEAGRRNEEGQAIRLRIREALDPGSKSLERVAGAKGYPQRKGQELFG